jgi:CheY-like chemotaxis protein
LRILLAEDDPVNQMVAQLFLEQLGYKADLAETGLEAVESARAKRYDVILMDCFLPGLDGYQAAKRIREECGAGDAPAIYGVTASLKPRESADWSACGMDGIVEKPLDAAMLGRLLAGCRKRS